MSLDQVLTLHGAGRSVEAIADVLNTDPKWVRGVVARHARSQRQLEQIAAPEPEEHEPRPNPVLAAKLAAASRKAEQAAAQDYLTTRQHLRYRPGKWEMGWRSFMYDLPGAW